MSSFVTGLTDRYRALFDAAPTAFIVTDLHLSILEANPAASELLEVELRFLPGKPLPTFFETSERRELRTWQSRIARAGVQRRLSFAADV